MQVLHGEKKDVLKSYLNNKRKKSLVYEKVDVAPTTRKLHGKTPRLGHSCLKLQEEKQSGKKCNWKNI